MRGLIEKKFKLAALLFAPWLMARAEPTVSFDWFEYTGKDAAFETPLPAGSYRNPILAGFYPDPSITRAGDKFYLVNSTFTYFPGIPVFESSDLVHWRLLGHVLDRPSQLRFDGLSISRGVFAPAIHYHNGVFYVLNTLVDSGGNFISTAKNPAGPWSDPVWLPEIDGIDPSLFVDADGKAYVLNNGEAEIRRASRDLDAGIRFATAEVDRTASSAAERRRGYFQAADLDRGAACVQERTVVLPHVRGRRHEYQPFRSDPALEVGVGALRTLRKQPDSDAAGLVGGSRQSHHQRRSCRSG
jgi:hypothetical protein